MIKIPADKLKKILIDSGYVAEADLETAYSRAIAADGNFVDTLVAEEIISEEILAQLLADYFKIKYVNLSTTNLEVKDIDKMPEDLARKYDAVVIGEDKGRLKVAMTDPSDLEAVKFLTSYLKKPITLYITTAKGLKGALKLYRREFDKNFAQLIKENVELAKNEKVDDLEEAAKNAPVVKILTSVFDYAASLNASDIHFEAEKEKLLIRFRVDGIMRDIVDLPASMTPAVVSRIKILSDLKIDEHRLPQEGRFNYDADEQKYSMRVSVIPTNYGERAELRVLLEEARPYTLTELGMAGRDKEILIEEANRPFGMLLVTGPTGSGKSTTLYAVLQLLNDPKVNIVTVEDPIEYSIPRISQMQINEDLGLTFAEGLKAELRQDPNVIMIGEIRDSETAKTAVNAALTGHILLSTLHTNDAPGAIPRLLDLGVEAFLLASTLRAVAAQRLVRKICSNCMKSVELEATPAMVRLVRDLAIEYEVPLSLLPHTVYEPTGCDQCVDGYRGRTGIYEVLRITPAITELIIKHAPAVEIKALARKEGMTTMLEDGLRKIQIGETTVAEVIRVIKE